MARRKQVIHAKFQRGPLPRGIVCGASKTTALIASTSRMVSCPTCLVYVRENPELYPADRFIG